MPYISHANVGHKLTGAWVTFSPVDSCYKLTDRSSKPPKTQNNAHDSEIQAGELKSGGGGGGEGGGQK